MKFSEFEHRAKTQGLDKPKDPKHWFFLIFVDRVTGMFSGGGFAESDNPVSASMESIGWENRSDVQFSEAVEVPDDKVPAEEYRNRLLTVAEVREVWPWVNA